MTRADPRAKQKQLNQQNRLWPVTLVQVPREQWPASAAPNLLELWRSRRFLVQVYDESTETESFRRLSVQRTALGEDGHWVAGLSWDDLQQIKRECGYGAHDAVEIYPPDVDVVNVANIRHLWVFMEPFRLTWRRA